MADYIRHVMWYTVWDAKTGDLIASGTAQQCARRLGYTGANSFASAVAHWFKSNGKHVKYTFAREYIDRSEVDSLPALKRYKKSARQCWNTGERMG